MHRTFSIASLVLCVVTFGVVPRSTWSQEFALIQTEDAVTVQLNQRLFTRYVTKSGSRPILWPLVGPTGSEMTRAFPMREGRAESSTDHAHHRSMWFGHGDVNGTNFWTEEKPFGTIRHDEFLKVESGEVPRIVTRNTWLSDDEEVVCTDYRCVQFGANKNNRWIDFDITIVNESEEPVTFGDTKEGCFALRVADSLRAEGDNPGKIVNAVEAVNKDAWGKTAAWVDYQGPDPQTKALSGIAILNHPASFRFPTYWHVRTYGLFAANVFGLHNFKNSHEEDGSHVLPPGESISFYYRVVFHVGDERKARIPDAFVDYAKQVKVSVPKMLEAEEPSDTADVDVVAIVEDEAASDSAETKTAAAQLTSGQMTSDASEEPAASAPVAGDQQGTEERSSKSAEQIEEPDES